MNAPPSTSNWWKAWFVGIAGAPLLGFGCLTVMSPNSDTGGVIALSFLGAGLLLHLIASIVLAQKIAAKRPEESRIGATIGLVVGLLFGGWAVMGALGFAGCLVALTRTGFH